MWRRCSEAQLYVTKGAVKHEVVFFVLAFGVGSFRRVQRGEEWKVRNGFICTMARGGLRVALIVCLVDGLRKM